MNVYQWFLSLDYFWIIFIISLVATLITTLIYKFTTDQNRLRQIKKEMKELQDEMKKNKGNPKKLMKIQGDVTERSLEMMKQSFKSMLWTFIPLLLILNWMAFTIAYEPVQPGQIFTVTAILADEYPGNLSDIKISTMPAMNLTKDPNFVAPEGKKEIRWLAKSDVEGEYSILLEGETFKQTKEVIISKSKDYKQPGTDYKESHLQKVIIGNKEVKPVQQYIGWGINWLWTYILLSILMSIAIRKIFNVV